jgi:hypothetical protein
LIFGQEEEQSIKKDKFQVMFSPLENQSDDVNEMAVAVI